MLAVWLLLASAVLGGCATWERVDVDTTPAIGRIDETRFGVGDTVEIVTRESPKRVRFTVTSIDEQAIVGPQVRILKSQVKELSVQRPGLGVLRNYAHAPDLGTYGALAGAAIAVVIAILVL